MIRQVTRSIPAAAAALVVAPVALYAAWLLTVFAQELVLRRDAFEAPDRAVVIITWSCVGLAAACMTGAATGIARWLRIPPYLAVGIAAFVFGAALDRALIFTSEANAVVYCESYPYDWVSRDPCR
jgi:hypothetical protein